MPNNNFTVRHSTPADLPAIVAIHNTAIPGRMASAYLKPVTVEERQSWFDAHDADRRPLLVVGDCNKNDEVIAWACLSDLFQREAYGITAEASAYVAPEYHGQGIGTWLFQQLIDDCPRLGVERIISLIFKHNAPSIRMHEKLGFEPWGEWPGVTNMDGERRDVVVLGKKIVAKK